MYQVGEILSIDCGLYRHRGIVFPNDMVLHCSKKYKRVVLELIEVFAEGRKLHHEKCPVSLSKSEIISRGEKYIDKPYRLFSSNCEHLISNVLQTNQGSPQIKTFVAASILAGIFLLSRR